jgi:hypothetical protein
MEEHPNTWAIQLLRTARAERSTEELRFALKKADWKQLVASLEDDADRKAFWINLYNAFFLILRKEEGMERPAIFRERAIKLAGLSLSLDEIEHGILRRFRWKCSLGYLPNPFYRAVIKRMAVDRLDPRIHFALNCGAKSCPPIAFYFPERIDAQLGMATASFLAAETIFQEEQQLIVVSRLFQWYQGDFGGRKGVRAMLVEYLGERAQTGKMQYGEYNWEEDLDNWSR